MRRTFQIVLLLVGFLPFALGVLTLVGGAERFITDATPRLDSQIRYYAVAAMLPFFIMIWVVRNMEIARPILVITLSTIALAGAARLVSALQYGFPEPPVLIGIVIEIGVLIFIPWYGRVMKQ